MQNQGFNYTNEVKKITNLYNQSYKLGLQAKNEFSERTKFSLDEVLEYLEYSISEKNQVKWNITKIIFYDRKTGRVELRYYAIDKCFVPVFKSLVYKDTEAEREINEQIECVERNEMMMLIGSKTKILTGKDEIFTFIEEASEEQRNYLEEDFFKFPEEYDFLYDIIIDHINRKNNEPHSYQYSNIKKV